MAAWECEERTRKAGYVEVEGVKERNDWNALHKGDRFNSQSEAEAIKHIRPQPAATRRRAQTRAAVGFLAAERSEVRNERERREAAKNTRELP